MKGSADNPISLDQNEETTNERETILDAARNKGIIELALLSSQPFDLVFAVIKTNIQGDIPTKQRELNKALLKYFKQKIGINISCEYFHPKLEPDYSDAQTAPNPCELLIYGVDFLTTKQIRDHFAILSTQIRQVIWINDSTCKLVYSSASETELVIQDQIQAQKIEEDSGQLPRGWFLIKPYTTFSFERTLWARYATSLQKNILKEKKQLYQKFELAKAELPKYLLDKFNATAKYKIQVEELERREMMDKRRHTRSPLRGRDYSRTRQKYRNNRRQFEEDRPRRNRNRYEDDRFEMDEVRNVRYSHKPVNMNDSYQYNRNASRNNQSNFEPNNLNTSFNYQRRQYLDYQRNSNQQLQTSFRFNPMRNNSNSNPNRNDLSFNRQNITRKVYYDAAQIDSELSFNQFGSARKPNERDDFHCDYNYVDKNPVFDAVDDSFVFDCQPQKNECRDTSFRMEQRQTTNNAADLSYNMGYNPSSRSKNNNDSFVINPKQDTKIGQEKKDFFDFLNQKSVVSSIRQANEQDMHQNSFRYDTKIDTKKKKQNKILNDSFYNQDSY